MIRSGISPSAVANPLSNEDRRTWDVLVVGAGPAGTTAASRIACAGNSVLMLDKDAFPREKVCGDGLIPDALKVLRDQGLYEQVCNAGHRVDHLTVMSPSGIRIDIPSECVTLRREILDAMLLEHALDSGAEFRVGTVTDVQPTDSEAVSVWVNGLGLPLHARVVVLATGADIRLLNKLGMVLRSAPSAVAVRCYVRSPVKRDELLVSFDRSIAPGYAWIFPLGEQLYNVGCGVFYDGRGSHGVNLRRAFNRFCETNAARELMSNGRTFTPLRGARLRAGLEGTVLRGCGRIVPVGEAVGATYPYTGEGIGKAMETSVIAAEQINAALTHDSSEPLARIEVRLRQELAPKYDGYRIAQKWISRPWLSDMLAARIQASERLQEATAGILNETTDPRYVFSWRNLAPGWRRRRARTAGMEGE